MVLGRGERPSSTELLPPLGHILLPKGTCGSMLSGKGPVREVDHSTPSSANVGNSGATPLFPLYSFNAAVKHGYSTNVQIFLYCS